MKHLITSVLKSKRLILFTLMCLVCSVLSGCGSKETTLTPEQWSSNVQNCWPCTLYKAVFDSMGTLTTQVYGMACRSALMLLAAGLLFWFPFKAFKMLFTFKQPNFKQYWVEMSTVLFKTFVVGAIIGNPEALIYTIDITLTPLMTTFIELSRVVITADPNIQAIFQIPENFIDMKGVKVADYPLFSQDLGYQIQDLIYRVFVMLKGGMFLAIYLFEQYTFMSMLMGLFIGFMFFGLLIVFPFMMVEVFFQMGVIIVLAPFFFVSWVFPPTKQWIKIAFNYILGGLIRLLITCTFVCFMMVVLTTFTESLWPGFFSVSRQMNDSKLASDMQQLTVGTLSFLFVTLFMLKSVSIVNTFAQALGGISAQSEFLRFFTGLKDMVVATAIGVTGALVQFIPGVGNAAGGAMLKAAAKKANQGRKQIVTPEKS